MFIINNFFKTINSVVFFIKIQKIKIKINIKYIYNK